MAVAGIIAEYNPFHRGHAWQIEAVRRRLGRDTAILCVMSGNCVQRGELAVFHKLARAEAAVRCGADLVLELPAPYVLGSAEPFARGAVALLAATGLVSHLAFGCETEDGPGLARVAEALDDEGIQAEIRTTLDKGLPYGRACQHALEKGLPPELAGLALAPNNLLGIEYLRAAGELARPMEPLPILRRAVGHDSGGGVDGFASATHIRTLLAEKDADPWAYLPGPAANIFVREMDRGRGPCDVRRIESGVLALLRLTESEPPGGWLDDSEGLSRRILRAAGEAGSLEELVALAKTKRYHASRIRRLILKMCLGMGPADRPDTPLYIKIMAAGPRGRALIRQMDDSAALPVITRPGQVRRMGGPARRMLELESAVTDLMALTWRELADRRGGGEWRSGPRMVEE